MESSSSDSNNNMASTSTSDPSLPMDELGTSSGFVDTPQNGVVPSFSFSGCGFLGVYHVGVAACLREHTDVVNRPEIKFAGASAGALVATTLLCGMEFDQMARILLDIANAVRDKEAHDLRGQLTDVLQRHLPEDAHIKLSNRLYISMTVMDGMECGLVTEFKSKKHLMQCLVATCFVPGFLGWVPPSIPAESFVEVGDVFPKLGEKEKKKKREKCRNEADNDHRTAEQREEEEEKIDMIPSESILDVICNVNSASGRESESNRSYIQMLLDLCLRSISTTSKVVQKLPGVPRSVTSKLEGFDDFVIDLLRELLSSDMKYMSFDGGFSDNIPSFDSNTITVCPFAGESEICPRDYTALDISLDLGGTSMQASEDNIFRLSHALNPMEPGLLLELCTQGYDNCLKYLKRKQMLCCKKHLMTRALMHSSPCNIGHAHCDCSICQASDGKIRVSLACVDCAKVAQNALDRTLPEDIKKEFERSIHKYQLKKISCEVDNTWLNFIQSSLWALVKFMCKGTVTVVHVAISFQVWFMRFMDNIMPAIRYRTFEVEEKVKLIKYILSSLNYYVCQAKDLPMTIYPSIMLHGL